LVEGAELGAEELIKVVRGDLGLTAPPSTRDLEATRGIPTLVPHHAAAHSMSRS
jgi:hypothetical protein